MSHLFISDVCLVLIPGCLGLAVCSSSHLFPPGSLTFTFNLKGVCGCVCTCVCTCVCVHVCVFREIFSDALQLNATQFQPTSIGKLRDYFVLWRVICD